MESTIINNQIEKKPHNNMRGTTEFEKSIKR